MQDLEADDPRSLGGNTIIARLGAGGMGRVYLARSPGGRSLALKVVRSELSEDPEFRRRFAREVAAARAVSGAFTAAVVAADPDGDPAWLATTYIPAKSLAEVVAERGPLPEPEVRGLVAGLAEALQAIHGAGIVHRDLKPSNVLLAEDGPRVIDFGIAAATEGTVITRTGYLLGTPAFMSPEQVTGSREVGPASDVFSLGALLVFASTGRLPFGSGQPNPLMFRIVNQQPDLAGVPASVTDVITRCLAKEPDTRPSVRDLLAALSPLPPVRVPGEHTAATPARSGEIHTPTALDGQAATRGTRRWSFLPKTRRTMTQTSQQDTSTATHPNPDPTLSATTRLAGPPRRLWMYEATSPIVWCRSDGTNFYVAEQRGRLTALDAASGTPRWRFPSDGHFHSGRLAFSEGAERIFLTTSTGNSYYLDATTGRVRWRHNHGDTHDGFH